MNAGDLELFTRVQQFGAFSPIFTNWGNNGSDDNLWLLPPTYQNAVRSALLLRSQLLPYRYTAGYTSHATGLGTMRSMYYGWPWEARAYEVPTQYMLGPSLLVAPVTTPMVNNSANVSVWFPPTNRGGWVALNSSHIVPASNSTRTIVADINDVPVFTFTGAVIATLPLAGASGFATAAAQYSTLEFLLHFPATFGAGGTWVYEDDGMSNDYLLGAPWFFFGEGNLVGGKLVRF